jgi:hypothetical protein
MKTGLLVATLASTLAARSALADERSAEVPIVSGFDAPPECPDAAVFDASVRAELSRRESPRARTLQVRVAVVHDDQGYTARATASDEQGNGLARTVQAPTCAEVIDIAATLVALAQSDANAGDTAATQVAPPAPLSSTRASETGGTHPTGKGRWLDYSITLGYGRFTAGPANPVISGSGEQTTFNPAQGGRLGLGVSHAFGWWRPSLEASAAYYRQGTSTTTLYPQSTLVSRNMSDVSDRDVLQATIEACPVSLTYRFLSFVPCATFSMIQSRGNSGADPELETGLGGSVRLRAEFVRDFFVEAMGAAVGVTSSYEPPSAGARMFYAVSLGTTIR